MLQTLFLREHMRIADRLARENAWDDERLFQTTRNILIVLRRVYGSVNRIEFYPGLFAEEVRPDSALPPLIGRIVGLDVFSQALTNPLLSVNVFHPDTFSRTGWNIIHETGRLADMPQRNVPAGSPLFRAFVTQEPGARS